MESQTREAIPGGEQGRANSAKPLLIGSLLFFSIDSLLFFSFLSGRPARQAFSLVGHFPKTSEKLS